MCPPFPMDCNPLYCFPFILDCTGNSTARLQSASNRLPSLPHFDIQVWTDGFVLFLFGPGGAGVTCSKCHTSNSLSFSTGPIASSFTAETFALKQGLDWCSNHLFTCKFQSVLFLTDSQSALSILSSAPLISCLSPSGMFGPSPPPSPTTPPCAYYGFPVTLVSLVMKMRIYLPKLVPPCPLMRSHALSPQLLPKSVIFSVTIGDVTSTTPI